MGMQKIAAGTGAGIAALVIITALMLTACTAAGTPEPTRGTIPTTGPGQETVQEPTQPPGKTSTLQPEDPTELPTAQTEMSPELSIKPSPAPTQAPEPPQNPTPSSTATPEALDVPPTGDCQPLDGRQYPEDCLGPEAHGLYEDGISRAIQGDYQGTAELIQKAQQVSPDPSGHLEMALGRLFATRGEPERAQAHFLESISIRDDGMHRVLWAMQLEEWNDCVRAEPQAQTVLELPKYEETAFNTHAEAHQVLAMCAWSDGRIDQGHEHMSEAYRLARETGYDFAVPDSEPKGKRQNEG